MGKDVGFGNAKLEIEHVEELALDATDIALAKDASAERPVDVF